MYAYMAHISGNEKISSTYFYDSFLSANCIYDSGGTYHITSQFSNIISGSLEDTNRYIEVTDRYHRMMNQKGRFQIKMCNNDGNRFIATLHNVLLAPNISNGLFLIITLMNLVHSCLIHKECCMVYFENEKKMQLLFHIVHRGNIHFFFFFLKANSKKVPRKRNVALLLLHYKLGYISIISLMDGDT